MSTKNLLERLAFAQAQVTGISQACVDVFLQIKAVKRAIEAAQGKPRKPKPPKRTGKRRSKAGPGSKGRRR